MKTTRTFTAAAAAAALVLGGLLGAAPAANADEDGIREVPRDQQLPSLPGLAPTFDTVTIVDAQTGAVLGTRPNIQGRDVSITGPVGISGGPVTIAKVTFF